MKQTYIYIIIFLFLSQFSHASEEQMKKRKAYYKKIFAELELTEEQTQKFKEYRKKNKPQIYALRKEIKNLKEKVKDAFVAKASDGELETLHVKMSTLQEKLSGFKFNKMVFLKNILSEAQRKDFMRLKKKYKKKRKH